MDLHELIYVGLATREMSIADLTALLDQSRKNNLRLGMTGLLVYHQREFMQILEGDKAKVFSLYDEICKDNRMKRNHLMWDGPIVQRSFAGWSMAFLNPGDLSLEGNPAYSSYLKTGFSKEIPGSPRTLGKEFLISLRDDFLRQ